MSFFKIQILIRLMTQDYARFFLGLLHVLHFPRQAPALLLPFDRQLPLDLLLAQPCSVQDDLADGLRMRIRTFSFLLLALPLQSVQQADTDFLGLPPSSLVAPEAPNFRVSSLSQRLGPCILFQTLARDLTE